MDSDRARQFASFAALKGFEEMIIQREHTPSPRRILSEDEAEILDRKLKQVERGSMLTVTYYNKDGYTTKNGMVSAIDLHHRTITIVDSRISLDDVIDLSGDNIRDMF